MIRKVPYPSVLASILMCLLPIFPLCAEDTDSINEVENLNALTLQYEYANPDSARIFNQQAMDLAHETKDWGRLSDAWLYRAYLLDDAGKSDSAFVSLDTSLIFANQVKDTARIATIYNNYGYIFYHTGDLDKALENYITFLRLEEDVVHDSSRIGAARLNIGNVHLALEQYNKAETYFAGCVDIFKNMNDLVRLGIVYNSLGIVNQYKEPVDYDKALEYYQKGLQLKRQTNDLAGIPVALMNIGAIYSSQKRYKESLKQYLETIPILKKINSRFDLSNAYKNTGMVYSYMGQYEKSAEYLDSALVVAQEIKAKNRLRDIYQQLSVTYEQWGKTSQAFEYYKTFTLYKDSVLNEENLQHLQDLEELYEKDKKEQQIKLLNKDNELQATKLKQEAQQKKYFAVGLGVMVLVAFLILRGYLQKKKSNRIISEQKEMVEEANEELQMQNEEIAAQRDEIDRQREILDDKNNQITASINYARRIQNAILPPDSLVKTHLPDSFVWYQAKDIVAGDFYWLDVQDGVVFFAAADCTGHGVPGAMVSVVCHGALNRAVREFSLRKPGEILDKVRDLVLGTFEKSEEQVKDGMDICLCAWDKKAGKLHYSGANNPLYIVRNKDREHPDAEVEIIKGHKEPIGYSMEPTPFPTHEIPFESNDQIYLFSDGFADQFGGPQDKKLGYKRFRSILMEHSNLPLQDQSNVLESFFYDWKGKTEQLDDVCIIGVKLQ